MDDQSPLARAIGEKQERIEQLEAAIRSHRDQRGDDRCWIDDETLYRVLPEGYTPPLRDSSVELALCAKYIECRHNPLTEYVSPQRRIEELEREVEQYRQVTQDGKRIPAGDLGQDPAYAAFVISRLEKRVANLSGENEALRAELDLAAEPDALAGVEMQNLRDRVAQLESLDQEWLSAARKAIVDRFDSGWGADGSPPECDTGDLYELCRGRGWSDTPEPVTKLVVEQRDKAMERIARLEEGIHDLLNSTSNVKDHLTLFVSDPQGRESLRDSPEGTEETDAMRASRENLEVRKRVAALVGR